MRPSPSAGGVGRDGAGARPTASEGEGLKAQLLDGKTTAAEIREELKRAVESLVSSGCRPHLALICVGEDPASQVYLRAKRKACEGLGVKSTLHKLPADIQTEHLASLIEDLNGDAGVHGILLQLPIPRHLPAARMIAAIDPAKDVDGFGPTSAGLLASGTPGFVPCTPLGVVVLLQRYSVPISGKNAVVIGRSLIVGRPLSNLLSLKSRNLNATVTLCHSGTADLGEATRRADILVAAIGAAGTVTGTMVKPGAAVVDVGMNRVPDESKASGYRLAGDVLFDEVCEVAGWITPVPGGVGPMTVAMLMANTVKAAAAQSGARVEPDFDVW
jgi:methylenetetrahydrofolate dehydrogenase (NADP+)/methenyltetrahydrofolate cyclohydrolase